jgi:actin-like protein 6A
MFSSGDELMAVVADVGTTTSRFGFAGEDHPKVMCPSTVGITDPESDAAKYYVGMETLQANKGIELRSPFKDGLPADTDVIQALWDHSYETLSLKGKEAQHPVVLSEPSDNVQSLREKHAEIMFEHYKVPALFICKTAVLSCFANGRTTGMIVDMGGGGTSAVPVHDGHVLQNAIQRCPVGGELMSKQLLTWYEEHGSPAMTPAAFLTKKHDRSGVVKAECISDDKFHPSYKEFMQQALMDDIKASCCRMSDSRFDQSTSGVIPTVSYELPDGTNVDVGPERFLAPELWYDSSTFGQASAGIGSEPLPKMVCDSIVGCDLDARKELFNNIVVTGGGSCFEGTTERLLKEVMATAPPMFKIKVIAAGASERRVGAWIGGSILGSLGTFHEMWVSKAEYEEHGASIVERKCP